MSLMIKCLYNTCKIRTIKINLIINLFNKTNLQIADKIIPWKYE